MHVGHICNRAHRWALYDAAGIFCCYVCEECEAEKKSRYRAEIFADPNYESDEPKEEC